MRRISFLQDIFSTVLDRRGSSSVVDDGRSMQELCLALLSSRGEVSGNRLAHNILARFENADEQQQLLFFEWLLETLDIDSSDATSAINSYGKENSPANWQALISATTPRRLELLRRINRTSESTGQLVSMREQLLSLLVKNPQLERIDADFEGLFKSWFNRGFLVLREIDWRTPANILEKIIHYEAVHAINDWQDLRRRLEPPDRKCFAFFHPAMQDEPLIFVEVALGYWFTRFDSDGFACGAPTDRCEGCNNGDFLFHIQLSAGVTWSHVWKLFDQACGNRAGSGLSRSA